MNIKAIIALVAVGLIGLLGFTVVGILFSANNEAVGYETGIKAQHAQNQNVLSQYSNKISEAAQVPTIYREDFTKVVKESMQGRYGKDGSRAAFQWLKEHNINYDSTLYVQLQRMIEAGRNNFETEQAKLIDKKRIYEKALATIPKGFFMKIMGFPKIDLASYNVVTSGYSDNAFKTGKEDGLKLR